MAIDKKKHGDNVRGTDEQLEQSTVAGKKESVLVVTARITRIISDSAELKTKIKIAQQHEQNRHWLICLCLRVQSHW